MRNEEAKQEAIKKAYGEYWDKVKEYVTEWGALSYQDCTDIFGNDFYFGDNPLSRDWKNDSAGFYCPESIYEIIHNEGWTRIEPDGSNLPKLILYETEADHELYQVCYFHNGDVFYPGLPRTVSSLIDEFRNNDVTHFKPIQNKPPIY